MVQARYFDGLQAASRQVSLRLTDGWLTGRSAEGEDCLHWAQRSMTLLEEAEDGRDAVVGCSDFPQARLLVAEAEMRQMEVWLPDSARPGMRLSLHPGALMVWGLLAVGCVGGALALLPGMMRATVEALPYETEVFLGDLAEQHLVKPLRHCSTPEVDAALAHLTAQLQPEGLPRSLRIRIVESKEVNAFALPDAQIVIFDGLLKQAAGPDELAGVLAHEIGHVAARHPMHGFMRALGMQGALKLMLGGTGVESMTDMVAMVSQLRYQRDDEREADAYALSLMRQRRIDPAGIAGFFARLEKKERKENAARDWLGYFSSHPGHEERRHLFEDRGGEAFVTLLSHEEWTQLKRACR